MIGWIILWCVMSFFVGLSVGKSIYSPQSGKRAEDINSKRIKQKGSDEK